MATLPVRGLLQTLNNIQNRLLPCSAAPLVIPKRTRHKVNIQHPWPGHINRQVLVKVTAPIIKEPYVDPAEKCTRRESLVSYMDQLTEYEKFLIRHQKKLHAENADGIIAVMHLSSCLAKILHRSKIALQRSGFELYPLNRKVVHHAVADTKYEVLRSLVGFSMAMVLCPKPRVKDMMAALEKIPHLHLMCAVVEGQLLSKTQVETYASYPDRLSMIAQTSSILNVASQTCKLLTAHQEQLVRNLEVYSQPDS
ncbi:large ribosomal subunit protein uL10m-like [Watersipora subatra]|uniref:large ribosomal subunit protein uL10m-like n=1 Tax=Watersipora subatra TaxID=2589382 RepID=UPI00355B37DB